MSKSKTASKTVKSEPTVTTYKTKKAWPDGGVRTIATTACKSGCTAASVAKALTKATEKKYSEKTALGVVNWLAAKGFLERVTA